MISYNKADNSIPSIPSLPSLPSLPSPPSPPYVGSVTSRKPSSVFTFAASPSSGVKITKPTINEDNKETKSTNQPSTVAAPSKETSGSPASTSQSRTMIDIPMNLSIERTSSSSFSIAPSKSFTLTNHQNYPNEVKSDQKINIAPSSVSERFRTYDNNAAEEKKARSRTIASTLAHSVSLIVSVIAIAVYELSTENAQTDDYFIFLQALSIISIINVGFNGLKAIIIFFWKFANKQEIIETRTTASASKPLSLPTSSNINTQPVPSPHITITINSANTKMSNSTPKSAETAISPRNTNLSVNVDIDRNITESNSPLPSPTLSGKPAAVSEESATTSGDGLLTSIKSFITPSHLFSYFQYTHIFLSVALFVLYFTSLLIESVYWDRSDLDLATIHQAGYLKIWLICLSAINTVCWCVICLLDLNTHWHFPSQFARTILFLDSLLLIGTSATIIILNVRITGSSDSRGGIPQWCFQSMQWIGGLCFLLGVHTFSLIFIVQKTNKERRIFNIMISTYSKLSMLTGVVALTFAATLLGYYADANAIPNAHINTLINADPLLSLFLFVLTIVSIIGAKQLLAPPSSGLRVERVYFNNCPPELLSHWASQIDKHTPNAEGMTGVAALELMKLYCQNTLPSIYCVCLRIRRIPNKKISSLTSTGEKGTLLKQVEEAVGADFECEEEDEELVERQREAEARAAMIAATKAQLLQSSNTPAGRTTSGPSSFPTSLSFSSTNLPLPAISEKQLKKAAKKDRKKQAKAIARQANTPRGTSYTKDDDDDGDCDNDVDKDSGEKGLVSRSPISDNSTITPFSKPKGLVRSATFSPMLPVQIPQSVIAMKKLIAEDDTEALILLTVVDRYDVTNQVKGRFGRLLTRTLGSDGWSFFQPLVLRLGLVAFQWPFRTSTFFLKPSPHPAGRAAACLRAVIEWNEAQIPQDRCDLLLVPAMKVQTTLAAAVEPAGFFSLALPPSHMQDMRPYIRTNMEWTDYLKTLKKGNRKDLIVGFEEKKGEIVHLDDSSPNTRIKEDDINAALKLWKQIATRRTDDMGETATFASPNPTFLSQLSTTLSPPNRALLFLKHEGNIIASCVLFKYPNKVITSDMQGLDHTKARPLRAYFVMMQWVIKYALENKYNFVDFGPTTGQAKVDAGCSVYELRGGGYSRNSLLGWAMKNAAKKVQKTLAKSSNSTGNKEQRGKGDNYDNNDKLTLIPTAVRHYSSDANITPSSAPIISIKNSAETRAISISITAEKVAPIKHEKILKLNSRNISVDQVGVAVPPSQSSSPQSAIDVYDTPSNNADQQEKSYKSTENFITTGAVVILSPNSNTSSTLQTISKTQQRKLAKLQKQKEEDTISQRKEEKITEEKTDSKPRSTDTITSSDTFNPINKNTDTLISNSQNIINLPSAVNAQYDNKESNSSTEPTLSKTQQRKLAKLQRQEQQKQPNSTLPSLTVLPSLNLSTITISSTPSPYSTATPPLSVPSFSSIKPSSWKTESHMDQQNKLQTSDITQSQTTEASNFTNDMLPVPPQYSYSS